MTSHGSVPVCQVNVGFRNFFKRFGFWLLNSKYRDIGIGFRVLYLYLLFSDVTVFS